MRLRTTIHRHAVLIEFLAGAGMGIFFHWVLHDREASYIFFGGGILLSLAAYLVREDLQAVQEELGEQYRRSHEITFAVSRITDPECLARARELFGMVMKNIPLLQQGYIPLDETEFLLAAGREVEKAKREVKSVNPITPGWNTRGAFVRYYQTNQKAVERGVHFIRIFVISRERLHEPEEQEILMAHLNDGFDVRVVYRDELPSTDTSWASGCSFNFAIYDDACAVDVLAKPSAYYGVKTSQTGEVAKYIRLFELIEHNARAVALVEGEAQVGSA